MKMKSIKLCSESVWRHVSYMDGLYFDMKYISTKKPIHDFGIQQTPQPPVRSTEGKSWHFDILEIPVKHCCQLSVILIRKSKLFIPGSAELKSSCNICLWCIFYLQVPSLGETLCWNMKYKMKCEIAEPFLYCSLIHYYRTENSIL